MLDNAIKQTFIELSTIILVVFVWTSLENLSKSNVTYNHARCAKIRVTLKKLTNSGRVISVF